MKSFSETLWPSGWALGQAIWAKMTPKLLHLWRQSQKIRTHNQKFFFEKKRIKFHTGSKQQ